MVARNSHHGAGHQGTQTKELIDLIEFLVTIMCSVETPDCIPETACAGHILAVEVLLLES